MYNQFFGLNKEPFSMTPDPACLFLTPAHREALAGLTYAILSRKGFVVLTGDAGTGKTTLLRRVFGSIPSARIRFSMVLNPTLTPSEFLELALHDFGIREIPDSKAQRLIMLQQFLLEAHEKRQQAVLVVDEAHKLPMDVLEELRLLSNFELAETKLLQIVLAGQTELADLLDRQDLRQLKQRISVRLAIHPLSPTGVEHYIQHRWQKAGATKPHPFRADAVAHIAQCSHGIPRIVNALCDNALMLAYATGETSIGVQQIVEVSKDLGLAEVPGRAAAEGPVQAPRAELKRNAPLAVNGYSNGLPAGPAPGPTLIPTLERYRSNATNPSRLKRLAFKLGLVD
jgi:general secretion pathway protein A